jgi:hypothetical protein
MPFGGSSIYAGNEKLQLVGMLDNKVEAIDLNRHGGSVNRRYLSFVAH